MNRRTFPAGTSAVLLAAPLADDAAGGENCCAYRRPVTTRASDRPRCLPAWQPGPRLCRRQQHPWVPAT